MTVERYSVRPGRRVPALLVPLVVAATVAAEAVDEDSAPDAGAALQRLAADGAHLAARVSWLLVALLALVSVLHYLAAATASRAAAGVTVPVRELVSAQFAASAANRLTPAGLGGAGVLGRYLTRRGGLSVGQAAAAVSALAALGGLADVMTFAVLIGAAALFGVTGAAGEVPLLLRRLAGLVPFSANPVTVALVAAAALTVAALAIFSGRSRSGVIAAVGRGVGGFVAGVAGLARCPGRLLTLMGASAATTLLLALGFACAAVLGPTRVSAAALVPLMIGYMVAAAAGNAIPTPGGIGAADAAFVGVLVAAHAGAAAALATVITFRVMTFWAPGVVGLVAGRRLRRIGAL